MARKTLATLRAGASKIRTEMEAVYNGDQSEAAILARLLTIGHTEKSALVCYRWHYENTSHVDGSILAAPTFETATREKKPVTADAPEAAPVESGPDAATIFAEAMEEAKAAIGETEMDIDLAKIDEEIRAVA